ncbi:MAG: PEGA domain-containing protein [Bdellovibrionales bacterium]|nr:PEGA domain-containing protein [Bdellovibrionales bacterium]
MRQELNPSENAFRFRRWIAAGIFLLGCDAALAADQTVIELESQPPGAAVFIDDRAMGTTPVRIANAVAPGKHLLRLELLGYQSFEKLVDVQSLTRLMIQLVPTPKPGEEPKKPIVLERKPPTGPGDASDDGKDATRDRRDEEEERERLLLVQDEDPTIPLSRTWIAGVWLGWSGQTFAQKPAAPFASLSLTLQRRLAERIGLQFLLGANLAVALQTFPEGGDNIEGSLRGLELGLGVPFFPLESGTHLAFIAPEVGIVHHGYRFTEHVSSADISEAGTFAVTQSRVGLSLNYVRMPYERHVGSVGYGVRLAGFSYGDQGSGRSGELVFQASGGLMVRF